MEKTGSIDPRWTPDTEPASPADKFAGEAGLVEHLDRDVTRRLVDAARKRVSGHTLPEPTPS